MLVMDGLLYEAGCNVPGYDDELVIMVRGKHISQISVSSCNVPLLTDPALSGHYPHYYHLHEMGLATSNECWPCNKHVETA